MSRRRAVACGVALIVTPALAVAGYCGALQFTGNVHPVLAGRVYRSAELDSAGFARVIGRYGIRSVVNLRGAHPASEWYRRELGAAAAAGASHYDIRLSAVRPVTAPQIDSILALLRAAPGPVLIHCKSGADRTGLVSALYLAELDSVPPTRAARQLSLAYGHFPWLTSRTGAMDRSFWSYVRSRPIPKATGPSSGSDQYR